METMTLKVKEGQIVDVEVGPGVQLDFDGIIAFSMSFMDSAVRDYVQNHPEHTEDLYDSIDYLFYKFMERCFPDTQPRDFDLSDAGLLYAQDCIIADAAKRGISYEDALKEYEDRAKEYVRKKAKVMAS